MASYFQRIRRPEALRDLIIATNQSSKQKVVIDFSSPNIAKQFHIGNLRSTILGRCFRNINIAQGNEVIGVNYLGDWGMQFAMIAAYFPEIRPSDGFWQSCSDIDKIKMLTSCYVVANNKAKQEEDFREKVKVIYQEMEIAMMHGNHLSSALQLWNEVNSISRTHLQAFYDMLGVHFDQWLCESAYIQKSNDVVQQLIKDCIARKTDDGLWVVDYEGKKFRTDNTYAIVQKSDLTSLYLSRDVASIIARDQMFEADKYIYVVDRAQRTHFIALKAILEKMGRSSLAEKVEHITFGRVKGLSTRLGRTEAVSDIIERGSDLALDFINSSKTVKVEEELRPKIAKELAISTIVFNDLKRARNAEYEFSFQNAFSLNQTNALLLQMKHSRVHSIEQRHSELMPLLDNCNTLPEGSDEVTSLVNLVISFDQIVADGASKQEPCNLSVYLIQLANAIGSCSSQLPVKDQPLEIAVPRLFLLSTARSVLANGMKLLGIKPVDKM